MAAVLSRQDYRPFILMIINKVNRMIYDVCMRVCGKVNNTLYGVCLCMRTCRISYGTIEDGRIVETIYIGPGTGLLLSCLSHDATFFRLVRVAAYYFHANVRATTQHTFDWSGYRAITFMFEPRHNILSIGPGIGIEIEE